jgi:hypothetical protein
MFNEAETSEEIAVELDKKMNELVEESESALLLQTDKQKALLKAKEAKRKESELSKHRKQFHIYKTPYSNLKLFVFFNLAIIFDTNEQYNEAILYLYRSY